MWKRRMRIALEQLAAGSGLLAGFERGMAGGLTVLTYHRVLPDALCAGYPFPSLAVPQSMFERQLAELSRRCNVLPLAQALALAAQRDGAAPARPLVALTFDDGYADNYAVAAPLLARHGLAATFFVVAGLVGTDAELWYDVAARRGLAADAPTLANAIRDGGAGRAAAPWPALRKPTLGEWMAWLKQLEPALRQRVVDALPEPGRDAARRDLDRLMTPDELRALHRAGHEVGSHTLSHPLLPQLDDVALEHELVASRRALEQWLGVPAVGFCYPNGDHDDRVVAAVRAAGYAYACTTRQGRNPVGTDRYRLRRVDMHPARSSGISGAFEAASFRATVARLHGWLRR